MQFGNMRKSIHKIFDLVGDMQWYCVIAKKILKAQVMNLSGLMGLLQQQPEDRFHYNSGNRVLTDRQIENAIDERKQAKLAGDYATADIIRKRLEDDGVVLEDSRSNTTWRRR